MEQHSDRKINYRELQGIAKKMHLPGNLKYNLLVEVIRARREGKEYVVNKILGEQKKERVRRKQEKLGSQESAYQHLRMTFNKEPTHVLPPPTDFHNTMMQHPNVTVTGISGGPPPHVVMANTNVSNRHMPYYPMNSSQIWGGVTNIYNADVRTVLQMPRDVFQNLHKKASEECHHRRQENHKKNPPMTYGDWLKSMEDRKRTSSPVEQNYIQDVNPTRDVNKGYYVETEEVSPNEERKSFQVRDILNKCASHGLNYEQHNSNQYDWSQLQCDIPSLVPDGFIPQIQTYLPSMNPWRNIYETVPDTTYMQQQYGYNLQQDSPSICTSGNAASPETSDTISATDEDLPKENNDLTNHITLPFHQSYITTTQREVQYLSQLDYEEPSTSNVPDLSSSIEDENQIIPVLTSEKDSLDSSDSSYIVIEPSVAEYHSH